MSRHTGQRDINAVERSKLAINLRKQGHTLDSIAEQCGYKDKSGAHRAIKRELDRLPADDIHDLRKLESERLDELYRLCMARAQKGDIRAIEAAATISERRSKLMGMDIPTGSNIAAAQVVIREVPRGLLSEPTP